MQNTEFVTLPIMAKAIQFLPEGNNWDEVAAIVKLNGGHAEMIYTDKNGQPAPPGNITEHKAVLLKVNAQSAVVVTKGNFIILNTDEMYPVPEKDFKAFYLPFSDINQIGNGQHTFSDLYKRIEFFDPTLEQILVTDKTGFKGMEETSAIDFIKMFAITHGDSEGKEYFVINGLVFVDNRTKDGE